MKYKITMDLKKYDKAVYELSKGNEEQIERSFNLIKQHNLYHQGLKLYANNEKISKRVKEALGNFLFLAKKVLKISKVIIFTSIKITKCLVWSWKAVDAMLKP